MIGAIVLNSSMISLDLEICIHFEIIFDLYTYMINCVLISYTNDVLRYLVLIIVLIEKSFISVLQIL